MDTVIFNEQEETNCSLSLIRLQLKSSIVFPIFLGFLTGVFTRSLNPNCHSFILDGELMGWHKEKKTFGSKGMNFDVKKLSASSHHQPCFVAFDVILHNDILLVDTPYRDRLNLLYNMFTTEESSLIVCRTTLISKR